MEIGLLLVLGGVAGWLTTVAGLGGGVFLILALSLRMSPAEALALSSPALLVGNLHRWAVGRDDVDRRIAVPFALGALPGSALGGLVVVAMPTAVLQLLLVLTSALALARAVGWWLPRPPPAAALVPAGAAIGAMAATTGSAGLALGAILQSAGLTGATYVATAAATATAMHVGRLAAYGFGGLVTGETLVRAAVLALAILAGNLAGSRFRRGLSARTGARIELGVLFACVVLALVGMA
ncbi:sulfite exporter TauE/SafE family protein [Nannocystis bainbridge]|uniref:Probable membrane transporter protein n=1 Tax=Nannocystis bainbridge TaxID=2995303 RepID=A0ABT5DWU6_9BACT|nr:sulfite exporter TauE/SafE family protein [Nannocystis bainbridge]MDC0718069.1 sulfite exporter TauE/SafE family protein [Nannocystis bainbridge]